MTALLLLSYKTNLEVLGLVKFSFWESLPLSHTVAVRPKLAALQHPGIIKVRLRYYCGKGIRSYFEAPVYGG